ncbi:(Fe-S)-binding protein [Clostridium botulinum B str. Osaka05]|uniref:(Fe-S)-binding protein n=1 Tax=Clostridium botulinum B str. Osaka05 TaxID=1407017 RepID=A0A0S6U8N1_CLOBO|nr:4Fe-4S binding protein [Clostridium botulinum]GAE03240.1 (Fe-S)-binding protein [Clostridium botulinum B str. Osaka05]
MKFSFFSFLKKYSYIILIFFIIAGMFNPTIALTAIICMIGPIFLAILGKGRFWCGNICPRGSFFDNVLINFSRKNKVPKFLKSKLFRTSVIIFMFYMFGSGIYKNWGNAVGIGMVFYRMIVVTTFIGIILSFFYNNRTWCNFCPMGSIASLISYFKEDRKKLTVSSSCISCKLCKTTCPMGIVPYDYKGNPIEHPDCIQCGKCINICPKNAIG